MNQKNSMVLGILLIISVIVVVGCTNHKALNKENFTKEFGAIGYNVSSNCEKDYNSKDFLCAEKSDVPYKVYFYQFETDNEAETVYEKYKSNISSYITSTSDNTETKGSDYIKTIAISDDEYIVISKVKNTVIFIASSKDYKNEVDRVLKNINY